MILKWRGELYAMPRALHEQRKKMADNIRIPVQVKGTTVPHLTNEGSILPGCGSVLLPVSTILPLYCFTPESVVGLLKTSTDEEGKQLEPSALYKIYIMA